MNNNILKSIQKLNNSNQNNTLHPTTKTIVAEETIQTSNLSVSNNAIIKDLLINGGEKSKNINSGALVVDGGLGVTENINTKEIKTNKVYLSDTLYLFAKGEELWMHNSQGDSRVI